MIYASNGSSKVEKIEKEFGIATFGFHERDGTV
jgi:hypothetical protein